MSEVTRILSAIEQGDPQAASQLLPLVYDELRKLAAQKLAQEKPGQTLQATALVHEAYLRLVGEDRQQSFQDRGHFFAAAATAMRRILIDGARRKLTQKRGGGFERHDLDGITAPEPDAELLALDEALQKLSLSGSALTDESLKTLTALTNLRELDVISTKLTASGIAKLQEALPKCKITTAAVASDKK